MNTGDIIKKLRNEKKITQTELGEMLGVNTSSIQKYESGATKNLKLETIRKLCHIFEVPAAIFVFPEIFNRSLNKDFRKYHLFDYLLTGVLGLTDEGKEKILVYIEDIYANEKYKQT